MTNANRAVVLTVDAGSGSCRALTWDESGRVLSLVQEEWAYDISEHPGGLDFNTEKGWTSIANCIRGALAEGESTIHPEDVVAVTCTSMREGFVVYDKDGSEIWAIPNVDSRAQKEAADLLDEGYGEEFFRESGDWTSLAASARLRWIRNNEPDLWSRAAHMTMLADWVLYRLSGEFVSDPSLGSSSALFNLKERDWSTTIADTLGIGHLLPRVAESGTVIGHVTAKAAAETGLREGTPVVTGGADTQLGLLGAGIVDNKQVGVVGGTYWLTSGIVDSPMLDPQMRLRTLCHAQPGQWMIEGCGFAHGMSTRWVRDGLVRAANPSIGIDDGYPFLTELAGAVPPGANGVHYFASNVMNTRSWKHPVPSIVGLSPFDIDGTGLGSVFRAVMEEGTYVARGHKELLEDVWGEPITNVAFVGGPSRSDLWCQMVSDVLNVDVRIPDVSEGTCLGAALCALVGAGVYATLADGVHATVRTAKELTPNAEAVDAYNELYPKWRALNDHMLEAADKGLAPYMWVGAGAASPLSQ
ncbi:FGGY family carbohydrate kinase [Propionicicella superfundia]|uniref:FGGY family carbohydrate kinase n=1 Tax=Propionicicella superfundia TaxID=348582 RepID=UPI000407D88B|nr:FGGY family carbohydrate kinase [Propionicicella superfundia]